MIDYILLTLGAVFLWFAVESYDCGITEQDQRNLGKLIAGLE